MLSIWIITFYFFILYIELSLLSNIIKFDYFYYFNSNIFITVLLVANIISIFILTFKNIIKLKSLLFIPSITSFFYLFLFTSFIISDRTEYEIFYLDGKLKAVISTHNEKYVFSDAYIDEDKKILTIFTKMYDHINIEDTKSIEYRKFNNVTILKEALTIDSIN